MQIKYQKKIIAFLDILGFSNIVYSNKTEDITKYFDYVFSNFKSAVGKNKFSYLLISDSIVIVTKLDKSALHKLLYTLCITQAQLLREGIILRGAVSFGELYINKAKNILVGSGLINAYKLEKSANYPRIIIDKKLITYYWAGISAATSELIHKQHNELNLLLFDPPIPYLPDFPYINYLRFYGFNNPIAAYKSLLDFLKKNCYDNDHSVKYEWIKKHVLIAVEERRDFFISQTTTSQNQRRFIKSIETFLEEFKNL